MGSSGKLVPGRGAQRRIQALVARGWSQAKLGAMLGIAPPSFHRMMTREHLRTTRHLEVVAIYDRLWNVAPPMEWRYDRAAAAHAMRWARLRGWAPPMAWDDIDEDEAPADAGADPEVDDVAVELAVLGEDVRLTQPERLAAIRVLNGLGYSDSEIADRLGIASRTVVRARAAADIAPAQNAARERIVA